MLIEHFRLYDMNKKLLHFNIILQLFNTINTNDMLMFTQNYVNFNINLK